MNWPALLGLKIELGRWRRLGRSPQLWWRDDDARAPGPALDRLLAAAAPRPLALAVVPDGDLIPLARRLAPLPFVTVSQHGVDHTNRSPAGSLPSEYPPDVTSAQIADAIAGARGRMQDAGLAPAFYTPTWNQIDERLARAIPQAGFTAVSADAPARPVPGAARLDSHIDILRWKGGPRFRGYGRILRALTRQLARRRLSGAFDAPVGLLTHHLVHDEASWRFLDWLTAFAERDFIWRRFAPATEAKPARCG